jgi:hypothetical protein
VIRFNHRKPKSTDCAIDIILFLTSQPHFKVG